MPSKPRLRCVHCGVKPRSRPRQLCWACYYTRGVREIYSPGGTWTQRSDENETEADLDAIIAEQMQCLPDWYLRENAAQHQSRLGRTAVPVPRQV